MIIISGYKVNSDNIVKKYSLNDTEKQILNLLALSNETYEYDYFNQLLFELKSRSNIIEAAKDLDRSDFAFETFIDSYCNIDYWTRTENGSFLINEGVNPINAINDIYINGDKYGTECSTAITIIYYKALINLFPQNLFIKLFPNLQLMNWHYINEYLSDIIYMEKVKDFIPGDRRYFVNPDFMLDKPEWAGENVILLMNDMYFGHGIGIETKNEIIESLNKYRRENASISAFLLEKAGRPNFKYLANVYYNYIA